MLYGVHQAGEPRGYRIGFHQFNGDACAKPQQACKERGAGEIEHRMSAYPSGSGHTADALNAHDRGTGLQSIDRHPWCVHEQAEQYAQKQSDEYDRCDVEPLFWFYGISPFVY